MRHGISRVVTVIDQKDGDMIFGKMNRETNELYVKFGSDSKLLIVSCGMLVYNYKGKNLCKIEASEVENFVDENFRFNNKRIKSLISKMLAIKACMTDTRKGIEKALNQGLFLS